MKNRSYCITLMVWLTLLATSTSQIAPSASASALDDGVLYSGVFNGRSCNQDDDARVALAGSENEGAGLSERGEELVPVAFLPSVLDGFPPIPDPMVFYVHVNDDPLGRTLDTSMYDGDSPYYGFTGQEEWEMTLTGDLRGAEYAYVIYASGGLGEATCDVEILLRRNGSDTLLVSWSQAFTAPDQFAPTRFTGTQTGIDPAAQAGDQLVLRIRKVGGSALGVGIWNGQQFGYSGYSNISVPGYGG